MKKLAVIFAMLVGLSGCSLFGMGDGAGGGSSASAMGSGHDVSGMISAAEAAIKKAKSAGGEWRDSKKKFIKKAKAAASKGDTAKAMKFAKKAKFEGDMGYKQAVAEKKAGPWLF